jgi:hypothetical protein
MASALEDVEKELKERGKKGTNSRNFSGEKGILSSANSKIPISGQNQAAVHQSQEESDDSINRPKGLESNREGAMMLMVMDSSASNH